MRKYLLAAALAAVISSPASARDGSGYVGVDLGALLPSGTSVDGKITDVTTGDSGSLADVGKLHYSTGFDAAVVAGYDFGMFRLEAEGAYKRAGLDRFQLSSATIGLVNDAGLDVGDGNLPIDDAHVRVLSGMINGLVDFGGPGVSFFVGAGAGIADVRFSSGGEGSGDTKFAWQLLAGIRAPVSRNIDLGLKYRYFQTGRLTFSDSTDVDGDLVNLDLSGKLRTHSILASLTYNFGAPAAPVAPAPMALPPSPPPTPVTQTCPDGTVIDLAGTCPPPPPPPAPPAPKAERG
jgi:opacity protein-like surface antigen